MADCGTVREIVGGLLMVGANVRVRLCEFNEGDEEMRGDGVRGSNDLLGAALGVSYRTGGVDRMTGDGERRVVVL